jgi:hypothetical protein
VLPNRIRCGDLYRLLEAKYAPFLKVPVADLIRHQQQLNGEEGGLGQEYAAVNSRMDALAGRYTSTDDIVAGHIPKAGFTLRLINGGTGVGSSCSVCPWLLHCDGRYLLYICILMYASSFLVVVLPRPYASRGFCVDPKN